MTLRARGSGGTTPQKVKDNSASTMHVVAFIPDFAKATSGLALELEGAPKL